MVTVVFSLFLAALAAEPLQPLPPRPEPAAPVPGECARAIGLDVRDVPPSSLVSGGKIVCAAVAVPPSDVADSLALESWTTALQERYTLDVLYLQGQVRVAEAERDWYAKELERERKIEFWQQPWVQRCVGGISVLAVAGVTAWGLGQIE